MTYDLSNPLHRKQFITRAKNLLKKNARIVELTDGSRRTVNQNSYLHCIIRILAMETGTSEQYAKDTYFKRMANPELFITDIIDPITQERKEALRSSSDLSVHEMTKAINSFRRWSEEQGYYLPEAHIKDDVMEFASEEDARAYNRALVETGRLEMWL